MTKPVNLWTPLILVLSAFAMLATSCATRSGSAAVGHKFREEATASLIIKYSSDQTIYMLKPEAHDGPFYRIFSRDQFCDAVTRSGADRHLAVVVIGYHRNPAQEQQVKADWAQTLAKLSFHRVVFLRANNSDPVTSLRIVDESYLTQVDSTRPAGELAAAQTLDGASLQNSSL
jgi:hypothetical protein